MMNFGTSVSGSIPLSANEVVAEASASSGLEESRGQRIRQLREAIEGGHYRVPAGDLADALLRSARRAN